jgi:ribosomal protein S18 acetylase RimI-like enzyme
MERKVPMEIRTMREDEAPAVSRIYAQSWKSAYRGIVPQPYLDALPEYRWTGILLQNPSRSFVLLSEGRYAGTASIAAPARDEKLPDWGEVISLYLLPAYFGRGFGRALLGHCIRALEKEGFRKVYLWVLEENRRARAFYEQAGFRPDGAKIPVNIGGKELTELRYLFQNPESMV